jgi:hypothetical protein
MKGEIVNTFSLADFAITGAAVVANPGLASRLSSISLFAYMSYTRFTGLLVVSYDTQTFKIGLKDGSALLVEDPKVPTIEACVNHLVSSNIISADAAAKAVASQSGSVLQALYEQGACTPREIVEALRQVKQEILDKVMTIAQGAYELEQTVRPPVSADPVSIDLNLYLVRHMRERTRTAYLVDLEALIQPFMGRYPMKTQKLTPAIAGVAFSEKERKTLEEVADGSTTLKDVFTLSLLGKIGTARLFIMAHCLGFVEFRLSPVPKGGIEVLEEELRKFLERTRTDDFFTRLQIHWTTHPSKIPEAYEKMAERYGPPSPHRRQSEKARELCEQIFALITEAYETLVDPDKRRQYRLSCLGEGKIQFGVEFLFKQAHLAKFRGETQKARELIESAIDIMPRAEFRDFLKNL